MRFSTSGRKLEDDDNDEIEDDDEDMEDVPRCRVCGCTDERGCPGGCCWVEDPEAGDLCSACAERQGLLEDDERVDMAAMPHPKHLPADYLFFILRWHAEHDAALQQIRRAALTGDRS